MAFIGGKEIPGTRTHVAFGFCEGESDFEPGKEIAVEKRYYFDRRGAYFAR